MSRSVRNTTLGLKVGLNLELGSKAKSSYPAYPTWAWAWLIKNLIICPFWIKLLSEEGFEYYFNNKKTDGQFEKLINNLQKPLKRDFFILKKFEKKSILKNQIENKDLIFKAIQEIYPLYNIVEINWYAYLFGKYKETCRCKCTTAIMMDF